MFKKASKRINEKNHTVLVLKQRRFLKNAEKTNDSSDALWKAPLKIITKSSFPNTHTTLLMNEKECEIDLGEINSSDYILLNSNYEGFYRCFYSKEMLTNIVNELKESSELFGTSLDRIAILNDAFALVNK